MPCGVHWALGTERPRTVSTSHSAPHSELRTPYRTPNFALRISDLSRQPEVRNANGARCPWHRVEGVDDEQQ
jgi:hypothetical protein